MKYPSFMHWIQGEVAAARCVLLTLYEQRDKLKYLDGPKLEREYMEKVGGFEQTVIQEEMECELLRKKQQMIQTAINRREPIDENAIDMVLDEQRQQMQAEAMGTEAPEEFEELSSEQSDELQELYREIVKDFHPHMHPELTEVHRQLFQKAQNAYRLRNLEELKLIHEMLTGTQDSGLTVDQMLELLTAASERGEEAAEETETEERPVDYTLASQVYGSFNKTAEEAALEEELGQYRQMGENLLVEMAAMKELFPYIAADMLSKPEKIEEYNAALKHRMRMAKEERERRAREIQRMMEEVTARG